MKHFSMVRRGSPAVVAGLALLSVAAGCAGAGGMDHGVRQPTVSVTAAFNDVDVSFAQLMIPHHQQAVEMATLAETRAADPEVKQLAAKIKAAQAPEVTTMTQWLMAWGMPTTGEHGMPGMSNVEGMPGMMSGEEMAQLKAATGREFDRIFARMMIAHHNGAIQNARDEQTGGADPAAKALAATIERTQTAEVALLQSILDRL